MKIVFFGDSITDMYHHKDAEGMPWSYGFGFLFFVAGKLQFEDYEKYQIVNRGIAGNQLADLYARVKSDVWNEQPDVVNILIGVNDVVHEITQNNGIDCERWERLYRLLIEDTKAHLPNAKIVLCAPFVLHGYGVDEHFEKYDKVYRFAKIVERLAKEYQLYFLSFQKVLDDMLREKKAEYLLYDGIHPTVVGAKVLADTWVEYFKNAVEKDGVRGVE